MEAKEEIRVKHAANRTPLAAWLMLLSCFASSQTLELIASPSDTLVDFQRTASHNIPEDTTVHNNRCENLQSYQLTLFCTISYQHVFQYTTFIWSSPLFFKISSRRFGRSLEFIHRLAFELFHHIRLAQSHASSYLPFIPWGSLASIQILPLWGSSASPWTFLICKLHEQNTSIFSLLRTAIP